MPAALAGGFDWNNIFIYAILFVSVLIFLIAYYFIRKSLLPSVDFDNKLLSTITKEDKEESLLYCISFFQDAYAAKELPGFSEFLELRIRVSIVFTFYKHVNSAAYIYMKLKNYYYKSKPLPDHTDKYKIRLREDGRNENDLIGAFCLSGVEEFSKLAEQAHDIGN